MSGTTTFPKIGGFVCTSGSAVSTGATLSFRWTLYPASAGATEIQLQGSPDAGATWQPWHRVAASATSTTKGGVTDGPWRFRVVARKSTGEMPGSASDPVAVQVGPVPVTPPPPATPTYATAADLAALAARVDALTARVAALEAAGLPAKLDALAARVTTLEAAGVEPAALKDGGASTAADKVLAVRSGEIVVATRG